MSQSCAIEIAGVRHTYAQPVSADGRHRVVALDGVELTIRPGEFVSVIGPSGCGKSTLLRMLAGLETPEAGRISLGGRTPRAAAQAKMLGYVPQTPSLLPWLSVLGNVTLPHKVNRRAGGERPDLRALLEDVGLGDSLHKLPAQLSGGMRQRTAIVRAFGLRPEVLLLDEPFAALDEFTREAIQEQLMELWEQTRATVVFVTHSITEAVRLSDRVVVMAARPGRVVDVVDVDLPRPRDEAVIKSGGFHRLELALRERLRDAFVPVEEAAR